MSKLQARWVQPFVKLFGQVEQWQDAIHGDTRHAHCIAFQCMQCEKGPSCDWPLQSIIQVCYKHHNKEQKNEEQQFCAVMPT